MNTTTTPDIRISTEIVMPKFDRAEHCRKIAAKGGKATSEKYGRQFYVEMGKLGLRGLAEKIAAEDNVPQNVATAKAVAYLSGRRERANTQPASRAYLAEIAKYR